MSDQTADTPRRLPAFVRAIDPAVATAFGCILLLLLLGSLYSSNFLSAEYLLLQLISLHGPVTQSDEEVLTLA